ncbi:MAG: YfjI family protein [Dinoroseobacter sp.]|nr:YfjI family protein [Dinoroseobacter sp.]
MNVVVPHEYKPEGPQPLVREIPRGEDYPVNALGHLKAAVLAVQRQTQAPVAIAAQSALAVASLAVQAHANVETLGPDAPTSLFLLTVAQSGERKSACDRLLMQGVKDHERDHAETYRDEMQTWELAHKVWQAKRDRLIRDATGSKLDAAAAAEADLRNLGPEPARPLSPKLTAQEPTLEGLVKLYQTGQPGLGVFSDEGGGFLGGHAMNSDNRLKTVAGLSSLWGGEALDRVRSGDGASTLYGRRLAMHLMVQPIAARPLLCDPVASGQGFLARFLIAQPQSAIGTRLARSTSSAADVAVVAMGQRVSALLNAAKPVKEDAPQELEPRLLPMSEGARELLFQYYQETEKAQGSGGPLEHIRAFASKSPEQAARIAGVLTLWNNLNAAEVSPDTMADAIALAAFYLSEAQRLSEAAEVSAETDAANRLLQWVHNSWPSIAVSENRSSDNLIPRDVVRFGPNFARETVVAKKLMKTLAAHGWLEALEKGAIVDGQSRQLAYRVVSS